MLDKLRKLSLGMFLLVYFLSFANAHLDAGEDRVINDYLMDFGYSPENPTTTERTIFSVNLLNNTSGEIIYPTDALITISNSKEIIFAGKLYPEQGNVVMSYLFTDVGTYDIDIAFNNESETIVKSNFEIKVSKKIKDYFFKFILLIILIIFVLICIKLIIKRNKKKIR